MRERSALEVFLTFLKLGPTSFGGPIAHIGYFREEIVVRRRWGDQRISRDSFAAAILVDSFLGSHPVRKRKDMGNQAILPSFVPRILAIGCTPYPMGTDSASMTRH